MNTRAPRENLEKAQLVFFLLTLCAGNFSIAVSQAALGLTLLTGLIRWFMYREGWAKTGTERTTLLLMGWALLMIPFSFDPGQSLVFYRRFFLFAGLWLGAGLAINEARRRLMFSALLFGAAGISLVGIVRVISQNESLFRSRLDHISNAMTSGAVIMLVALVTLGMLLNRGTSARARWVVSAALVPILLTLVMTMTRSAMLGLIAGVAVMLLVARPRWFVVFGGVSVVLAAVILLWGEQFLSSRLWGRVNPENFLGGGNTLARVQMWQVGWQMIKAHPWLGVGDCDLQVLVAPYYDDERLVVFGHLHSNLVQLAVIWGVPGFLMAMAFLGNQPRLLWRRWRQRLSSDPQLSPWQGGWILGALGMWTGFFVAGLTEWYFGDAEPMLLYMAILGIALGPSIAQGNNIDPDAEAGAPHA